MRRSHAEPDATARLYRYVLAPRVYSQGWVHALFIRAVYGVPAEHPAL